MITVEEALEHILSYIDVLEPEEKPLLEALGQVLAEDVTSDLNIPPLDNTAMDGDARRAQAPRGASPASP
ncbi:MAG: molybdopterin molybdenumtransferase MoeA, partial [Dehalococcoidia bacterium]